MVSTALEWQQPFDGFLPTADAAGSKREGPLEPTPKVGEQAQPVGGFSSVVVNTTSESTLSPLLARLEQLFTRHVDQVFNVSYRLLWNRSDAEDVVQNTFLKASTHLDQLRDPTKARPWLLQIAYRESIGVIRRRRDVPLDPTSLRDIATTDRGPADTAVAGSLAQIVAANLAQLNSSERTAVVLRDVEELPMHEVATVMGIGLSAAKMRVHRGRAALRVLLEKELADAL